MANEADTCRAYVVPKLQQAGWDRDPHSITEQRKPDRYYEVRSDDSAIDVQVHENQVS